MRGIHAPHDAPQTADRLEMVAGADHRPGEQVVVATEVFRGRVQDEIDPRLERSEVVRRAERGVDERQHAVPPADVGEAFRVDDAQVGICRRLAHEEPRPGRDRRLHRVVVARRHLTESDAESREVPPAELAAAMVALVEEDDLVPRADMRHEDADQGRHSGGEQHGILATVELGELPFHHLFAGIAVAAVLLARLLLLQEIDDRAGARERVGRRGEDRVGDREAGLLPRLAGMHRGGRGAGVTGRADASTHRRSRCVGRLDGILRGHAARPDTRKTDSLGSSLVGVPRADKNRWSVRSVRRSASHLTQCFPG